MEEITIKTVFVQSELSINEDAELDVMMRCGVRKRGKWHSVSEVGEVAYPTGRHWRK